MALKQSRFLDVVHPTVAARKKCKRKNSVPGVSKQLTKYTFRPIEPAKVTSSLPIVTSPYIIQSRLSSNDHRFPEKVLVIRANRSETGLSKKKAIMKRFPKSQSVNTLQIQRSPGHKLNQKPKQGDRVTRKPPIPIRLSLLSNRTGSVVGFRDVPASPSMTKSNSSFFSKARISNRKLKPVFKTTLVPHIVPNDLCDVESTVKTDPYWEFCQEEFFEGPVDTKDEGTSCALSGKNLAALRVSKDESDDMLSSMTVSGFGKSSARSRLSSPSLSHEKLKYLPRSMGARRVIRSSSQRGPTLGMLKKGKGFFKFSKLCNSSLDKRPGLKKFQSLGLSPQQAHKPFRKKEKYFRPKKPIRVILMPSLRKKGLLHKKCATAKIKRVSLVLNKKSSTKHRTKEISPKKLISPTKQNQRQPNKTIKIELCERKISSNPKCQSRKATFQPIPFSSCNISASNRMKYSDASKSTLQSGVWQKINQSSRISPYQGLHHSLSYSAFHPYQKPSSNPGDVNQNVGPCSSVKHFTAEEQVRHIPHILTYSPRSAIHNFKKDSKSLRSSEVTLERQSKNDISFLKERTPDKRKQYFSGSNFDGGGKNQVKLKIRSLSCSPKRSKKSGKKRNCCASYHTDLQGRNFRISRNGLCNVTNRTPERSPGLFMKSLLSLTSSGVQGHTRTSSRVQFHTRVSSGTKCNRRERCGVQFDTRASSWMQNHKFPSKTILMRNTSSKSTVSRQSPSPHGLVGKKLISSTNKTAAKNQMKNTTLKHLSQPSLLVLTHAKAKMFTNKSIGSLKADDRLKSSFRESRLTSPLRTEYAHCRNRSHSNKCAFRECPDTGSKTARWSPCKKSLVNAKSRFKDYAAKSVTPFRIFSIASQISESTLKMTSSSERFFNVSRVNRSRKEMDTNRAWSEMRGGCAGSGHFDVERTQEVTTGAKDMFNGQEERTSHSGQFGSAIVELLSENPTVLNDNVTYPKAALVTTKGVCRRTYFFDEAMNVESVTPTTDHGSYQQVMHFLSNSFSSSQQNQNDVVRSCSRCSNKEMTVGDTNIYRILQEGVSELIRVLSSPSVDNSRSELEKRSQSFRDGANSESSTLSRSTLHGLSSQSMAELHSAVNGQSSSDDVTVSKLSSNSEGWCSFHSDAPMS